MKLQDLARIGAAVRYEELQAELRQLRKEFPELARTEARRKNRKSRKALTLVTGEGQQPAVAADAPTPEPLPAPKPQRPPMSPEHRAKISESLKRRSAERKLDL